MTDDFMQSPEFQALIKEYLEYLNSSLAAIKMNLSDGLYQDVYKFAHNIKGTGTSYGYENLTLIGTNICKQITENKYAELDEQLNQIEAIIKADISWALNHHKKGEIPIDDLSSPHHTKPNTQAQKGSKWNLLFPLDHTNGY